MSSYAHAAEYYDALYAGSKDYEHEASRLLEVFAGAGVPVRRVLDVGCGTGRHAEALGRRGLLVDGLDLEPAFVRLAAARNPGRDFHVGDMTAFEVSEPYDAVLCLFGTIGYAADETRLRAATQCLHDAVRSGGLVAVEPWLEPGDARDGHVTAQCGRGDGLAVARVSRLTVSGSVTRLEFEYLVARRGGIERLSERHELGLYPQSVMLAAFEAAGLRARYEREGLTSRSLYVATRV